MRYIYISINICECVCSVYASVYGLKAICIPSGAGGLAKAGTSLEGSLPIGGR